MNIYAIVCKVLEADDIILTAYQTEALLAIIDKLPNIERHALDNIRFDVTLGPGSISELAIQHLKDDETFTAVASLGAMSTTDLIDILAALATGNEDDFGYWTCIKDEPEIKDNAEIKNTEVVDDLIERFLNAQLCCGRPHRPINHETKHIFCKSGEADESYVELYKLRGGYGYWLTGHIYYPMVRAGINTNYDLLMYLTSNLKLEPELEPQRIGQQSRNVIERYFIYWLGCKNVNEFARKLKESGFKPQG